ncbi:phosphotransferase [Streptomyces sp. VRA16 Mangrove soil]|uniref:phosphotransferase n=1 Tax=Streptomyces sp. VRA16 Mangrove soil TaxID=2817434 RepID=UPI001A9D02D9|nr:phosphotransferase [Streptomyces sp. VRA16 Mangrove soil]MBO1336557.1 phosphotransferase [Streptomyces sp. VRA16 Mangrove soil]
MTFDSTPHLGEPLPGGHVNQVVRVADTVRRAPTPRSSYVRELLALFGRAGWPGAPRFLGTDERGRESFTYLPGRAALTPQDRGAARTDEALARLAVLVRQFHDLTAGTPLAGDQEVVCHHDLDPRNTVYEVEAEGGAWTPVAFIDWDLAGPGRRVEDVAHVCWQYLELGPDAGDVAEAARRMRLVCDAYGLDDAGRAALPDTVLWWQDRCRRGIAAAADAGDPAMRRLRAIGAVERLRAAHDWVAAHRDALYAG